MSMTCPNRQQLQDFLVGTLPADDADTIAAHLEACITCQDSFQALDDGRDSFISLLRQPAPVDEYADEPARGRLVHAAKGLLVAPAAGGAHSTTIVPDDQTMVAAEIGEYELLEKIGQGGMGAVYKARQKKLKRIVAIKLLPKERLADPKAVARFEREMEAVGAVDHPNIVRAMHAGEHEGQPYLAIEYVDGLSLAEVVTCLKALRVADACELVRQAAAGLQHAHERRLVHRDIKPSNLMLTLVESSRHTPCAEADGTRSVPATVGVVKVLDLGLALLHTPASQGAEMTTAGSMMGTADYVAPEQVTDSHSVDIRADIYSLGCTLYKLLSGRAPFVGPEYKNDITKVMAHVQATPPPITLLRSDVSNELAAIIQRMMAKAPAQRYAAPADVAAALAPFAAGADLPRLMSEAQEILAPGTAAAAPSSVTAHTSGSAHADTATSHSSVPAPGASAAPVPRTQPAPARRWPPRSIAIALTALAASFLLIAPGVIVLRIRDKDGREMVITLPDDSHVVVEKEGKSLFDSGENAAQKPEPISPQRPAVDRVLPSPAAEPVESAKPATASKGTKPEKPAEDFRPIAETALNPTALVVAPAKLPGLKGWTIETTKLRSGVFSLAYNADGTHLASGGPDGVIRIWDARKRVFSKALLTKGHAKAGGEAWCPIQPIVWAEKTNAIAAANPAGGIEVFDETSGRRLCELVGHEGAVRALAWNTDEKLLASVGADKTLRLWSIPQGDSVAVIQHDAVILTVRWTVDSAKLTTFDNTGKIVQWDASRHVPTFTHDAGCAAVLQAAEVSHDGQQVCIATKDKGAAVWKIGTERAELAWRVEFKESDVARSFVRWSRDDELILGFTPGMHSLIVNSASGALISRHWGCSNQRALAWSPSGRTFVSGDDYPTIRWLSTSFGQPLLESRGYLVQHPERSAHAVTYFIHWNASLRPLPGAPRQSSATVKEALMGQIVCSPDGRHVVRSDEKKPESLIVVDTETNTSTSLPTHFATPCPTGMQCWAFSPDGAVLAVATGRGDNRLLLYDTSAFELRNTITHPLEKDEVGVFAVTWSADGATIATRSFRKVYVWDAKSLKSLQVWMSGPPPDQPPFSAFSPDGKTIAFRDYNRVRLQDVVTGDAVANLAIETGAGKVLSWMPDGQRLAIKTHDRVVVVDVETGEVLRRFGPVSSRAVLSSDGEVVTWSQFGGAVRVLNLTTGRIETLLNLAEDRWVIFSPDGHYRCTAGVVDELVYVVETDAGEQQTLTPAEFADRFGWKNDPSKATLIPAE